MPTHQATERLKHASVRVQFQRNRFAEDARRLWAPRWLGYQLSRIAPLFFRWRRSPSVNAAFKVSARMPAGASLATRRAHCKPVLTSCWLGYCCAGPCASSWGDPIAGKPAWLECKYDYVALPYRIRRS